MKINYDKTVDAMYVYFKKGKISKTQKISPTVFIDIDKEGKLIGLEILNASQYLSRKSGHQYVTIGNKSFDVSHPAITR